MSWFEDQLKERLERYSRHDPDEIVISIKIRSGSGDFNYGGGPELWEALDRARHGEHRRHVPHDGMLGFQVLPNFHFEQHESGPEFLTYLALAAAGVSLGANLIQLITAIIQAKANSQKAGQVKDYPIELTVRGFDRDGKLFDHVVLKVGKNDTPDERVVETALLEGVKTITVPLDKLKPAVTKPPKSTMTKRTKATKAKKQTKKTTKRKKG